MLDRFHDVIEYEGTAMKRGLHIDFKIPEQFNLTTYILEDNVAQGRGNKTAVRCEDEHYTYNELCGLTNRFGNILKELGVGFQERVLLILQDSPEWMAAWFASMKIGAVVAHAYTYLQPSDYDYLINYVQPRMVVVDKSTLELVRKSVQQASFSTALLVAGDDLPALGDREYALKPLLNKASSTLEPYPHASQRLGVLEFFRRHHRKAKRRSPCSRQPRLRLSRVTTLCITRLMTSCCACLSCSFIIRATTE